MLCMHFLWSFFAPPSRSVWARNKTECFTFEEVNRAGSPALLHTYRSAIVVGNRISLADSFERLIQTPRCTVIPLMIAGDAFRDPL